MLHSIKARAERTAPRPVSTQTQTLAPRVGNVLAFPSPKPGPVVKNLPKGQNYNIHELLTEDMQSPRLLGPINDGQPTVYWLADADDRVWWEIRPLNAALTDLTGGQD